MGDNQGTEPIHSCSTFLETKISNVILGLALMLYINYVVNT